MFQNWFRSCLLSSSSDFRDTRRRSTTLSFNRSIPFQGGRLAGKSGNLQRIQYRTVRSETGFKPSHIWNEGRDCAGTGKARRDRVRATLFQLSDASAAYGFFTNREKNRRRVPPALFRRCTESFQTRNVLLFLAVQLRGSIGRQLSDRWKMLATILVQKYPWALAKAAAISNHLPSTNLIRRQRRIHS